MQPGRDSYPLRDVLAYPPAVLEREDHGIRVGVRYEREWQDGFGARGWKLNHTLADPEIIASTRETGDRIPTSVFVHDVLDHLLSGFAPSGHRAEAMALAQLGERTDSDIRGDYEQMVREDLLAGRVVGESLERFIGPWLLALAHGKKTPAGIIQTLCERMGKDRLVVRLVERFETLGHEGHHHARGSWEVLGLPHAGRASIGLALQKVLSQADTDVQRNDLEQAEAHIRISTHRVSLEVIHPGGRRVFAADVKTP